jgi:hypothetical protein
MTFHGYYGQTQMLVLIINYDQNAQLKLFLKDSRNIWLSLKKGESTEDVCKV